MKVVVDANALFSFFKKDSKARELILDPELKFGIEFFSPERVMREVGKHKDTICSRFGIYPRDFDAMFSALRLLVKTASRRFFEAYVPKAVEVLAPNFKDVAYASLAFSLKETNKDVVLWSNDKGLKVLEKHGIKVYSTSEILEEFGLI